ncbi:MAG: hypothetical protein QF593_11695, partial [Nitrospinota bacterium]|nr:hypothetical protein [Nitrospinota bacterium]
SEVKTVSDLTAFLHWRMNVTADTSPRDRPFLDVAVDGTAYCNQIAVGLAHLLAKKGIQGRLAMLRNKQGVSPHSVTEVLLDGRWVLVDPLNGIFPGADRGGVTLRELGADFSTIENLPVVGGEHRLSAVASDGNRRDDFVEWYRSFVVSPIGPDRPGISFVRGQRRKHRRVIRLTRLYYQVFGRAFSSFVQDIRFVWNRSWLPGRNLPRKKLARARHYALHARWHKALPLYREVLASAAGPVREDALFFSGMALLEAEQPRPALNTLNTLVSEFPEGRWKETVHFYRGEALRALGLLGKAEEAYRLTPRNLLTPARRRLTSLNVAAKPR